MGPWYDCIYLFSVVKGPLIAPNLCLLEVLINWRINGMQPSIQSVRWRGGGGSETIHLPVQVDNSAYLPSIPPPPSLPCWPPKKPRKKTFEVSTSDPLSMKIVNLVLSVERLESIDTQGLSGVQHTDRYQLELAQENANQCRHERLLVYLCFAWSRDFNFVINSSICVYK